MDQIDQDVIANTVIENQNADVECDNKPVSEIPETDNVFDAELYDKMFDDETQRYREFRNNHQDPVTYQEMKNKKSFKFKYVWDCYTGERIGVDPYGPLYLSPVTILRTILSKILLGLWTEIEGCMPMYGENIGVSKKFNNTSRGPQPEKYVFRIPIQDCYLHRGSDKRGKSVHTLGPELTDDELLEINNLIGKYWSDDPYIADLPKSALKILELRKLYDVAIDPKPTNDIEALPLCLRDRYLRTFTNGTIDIDHNEYINRIAVEEIKKMIGFRSKMYF